MNVFVSKKQCFGFSPCLSYIDILLNSSIGSPKYTGLFTSISVVFFFFFFFFFYKCSVENFVVCKFDPYTK